MLPVSLDVALLRLRLPELVLRPGMSVVARVAARGEGPQGSIVLAGQLLKASLPDEVRAGDTLRLKVAETSADRVVLKLEGTDPALGAASVQAPPPETREADPDGGGARRQEGGERSGVSLAYDAPALGRLDIRVERGPEGVRVTLGTPAGTFPLARAGAETLRAALEARTGTPATVSVVPRREPFDAYA